jgi:hypothetical protein
MKKTGLLLLLLAMATIAMAVPALPAQKAIQDQAEYRAYTAALDIQDAAQKATALEAFVAQYPNSVVKMDALEQALASWEEASNQAKMEELANTILKASPDNLRALATLAYMRRSQTKPAEARQYGLKGLDALSKWQKPEDMQDDAFETTRKQMTTIFAGACGFGALQAKQYAAARDCYLKSLQANPDNLTDSFQAGVAQIEMDPVDPRGFWYVAKAVTLAKGNAAAIDQIAGYGKGYYTRYHGSAEGWDQIVAQAAAQSAPPANFAVKAAPGANPAPAQKAPARKRRT